MKNNIIITFILGIAVGVLICNIVSLSTPIYANATGGKAGGIIAVTGLCSNNYSGLWVIDARDTKYSPSLCLYVPLSGGRYFKLAAARRIKWDLMLVQYKDKTDRKYSPGRLKRKIREINKKQEEKTK